MRCLPPLSGWPIVQTSSLARQSLAFQSLASLLSFARSSHYRHHRTRVAIQSSLRCQILRTARATNLGNDVRGDDDDLPGTVTTRHFGAQVSSAKRTMGSLGALSGGAYMSYVEQNKSANKELAKESASASARHKLFAKLDKQLAQARKDARKETAAR
ncbi:hypothetical protein M0805_001873 [Coniferiporia weirii]|nr:hypothetical protein M0805_001873 [Coniferiporia weirii]